MAPHLRSRSSRQSLGLESLESRTLLTATIARGILAIRGTAANDIIEIRRADHDTNMLEVVENGGVTFSRQLSSIRRIRIDAGGGDDEVAVNQANGVITIPTVIRGGIGDDLLQGGAGSNQIDGGPGRDAFEPGGGRDRVTSAGRVDRLARLGTVSSFRDYLANAARRRDGFGDFAVGDGIFRALGTIGMAATTNGVPSGSAQQDSLPAYSETNTQVAGVDEGDIIENDGRHLYVLSRGELLVIDAENPDAPTVVSRTEIDGMPLAEYLHEGRLTVLSSVWDTGTSGGGSIMPLLRMRHAGQVRVTVYDVADPSEPRLVSRTDVDGGYNDSRMVDGRLALVVQNDLLAGYWAGQPLLMPAVMPQGRVAAPLAPLTNVALVNRIRRARVDSILPTWSSMAIDANGVETVAKGLVSRPQDVLCPTVGSEANLTSVVLIDVHASKPGISGATSAIGGYASTLHMNADDLYVFSPRWNAIGGDRTTVQRFDISGSSPRLISSGVFAGHLLNQFSADAQGDLLRVAVTSTTMVASPGTEAAPPIGGTLDASISLPFLPWTATRTNAVHVLATRGDTLSVIGSVDDIAPGESIMSARFVGDRAYMVTFLQVDPLYTIDLSVPTAPRIAGELKVPGFSRFLQPLGAGYLLGVGRDADAETGLTRGLKVSLYDVRDAAAPAELSTFVIDQPAAGWSWSDAEWDHHALGFFPELGIVTLPVETVGAFVTNTDDQNDDPVWQQRAGVVVLHVDPATPITTLGTIEHDSRLLRAARIGDVIYSVADLDLRAVEAQPTGLASRGTVVLQQTAQPIYVF